MRKIAFLAFVVCCSLLAPRAGLAQSFVGLGTGGASLSVYSAPGATPTAYTIAGLNGGEQLVSIDFFTSNGNQLFGLSNAGRLVTLAQTGPATFTATTNVASSGITGPTTIDFNPMANRLRVYAGTSNFRLTPTTGLLTPDGTLAFIAGDPNAAATPNLTAAAYLNNFPGAASTALYSLDANLNILILNTGAPAFSGLMTIGALNVGATTLDIIAGTTGFDILSANNVNIAYLSSGNALYTVNLATGALTSVGTQAGPAIIDIAFIPEPGTWVLLVTSGLALVVFAIRRRYTLAA